MIKSISLKFDTYSAPRITEIQTNSDVNNWYWIQTKDNPADLGTREKCSINDLLPGTLWREGPVWLKQPRDSWPIRSDFKKHAVPGLKKEFEVLPSVSNLTQLMALSDHVAKLNSEQPVINVSIVKIADSTKQTQKTFPDVTKIVDASKYNCWFKLIHVSSQVLLATQKWKAQINETTDLTKCAFDDKVQAKKIVRKQWLQSMMPTTKEMLKKTKLTGFIIFEKDDTIYTKTRNKQENLNPDEIVIVSPNHRLSRMILNSYHNIQHKGVKHTVARSRIFFWIPQASKIVTSIKNNCFKCRLLDAEANKQLMAPLPAFRLKSSPVWFYSMLDLFGPVPVKGFVNQRTTRKTWGVVITCLTTRACWVYLAESFSTDHLLCVLIKHEARNGSPSQYFADLGSQIVGADRIMSEAMEELDVNQVIDFAANRNVKFNFGVPHYPEGQGAVERLVQEVKNSLKVITNKGPMTYGELDTALSEASYLVNSRPLQPNPALGEDGFICPNDIMMGRSDKSPPLIDVADCSLTRRISHIKRIVEEFWDKWSTSYYQSLVKYHKWVLKDRNSKVGDIVLILDREGPKGKFTLGQISSVKLDPDNITRKVTVKYKMPQKTQGDDYKSTPFKYAPRSVRGLALVMTVEKRDQVESIDLENIRSQFKSNDASEDTNPASEDNVCTKEIPIEDKVGTKTKVKPQEKSTAKVASKEGNTEEKASTVKTSSGRKISKPRYFQASF